MSKREQLHSPKPRNGHLLRFAQRVVDAIIIVAVAAVVVLIANLTWEVLFR